MINLQKTREAMLAEIGASAEAFANRFEDPADPAFLARREASAVVRGTGEEILSRLQTPVARRLADLPPEQFLRDVGRPLKMGLGNAFKRGNRHDPEKRITGEAVVTERGVLLSVSDEGPGFDPVETLRRLRADESYYAHKGGGFKAFERAGSVVSFADGGRTLLIRFLCDSERPDLAVDPEFMQWVLRKLPMISKRGATLRSCRFRKLDPSRPGRPEIRYELESCGPSGETRRFVLIGRVLSESAARREYRVARQLYKGSFESGTVVRLPKPLHVFHRHPRLVLYRFDPQRDLRRYLDGISGSEETASAMRELGAGLRALHLSGIVVDVVDSPGRERRRRSRIADRVLRSLSARYPDRVEDARALLEDLDRRAGEVPPLAEPAPVHGSFGWDCVRRAQDRTSTERFYVYRFDECRISHPAHDVGGFLADLARWSDESAVGRALAGDARDAFLSSYRNGDSPDWLEALPYFTAGAHLARLDDLIRSSRGDRRDGVDAVLRRCREELVAA